MLFKYQLPIQYTTWKGDKMIVGNLGNMMISDGMLLAFVISLSWVCALISTFATKDARPFEAASQFSIVMAIGFALVKHM